MSHLLFALVLYYFSAEHVVAVNVATEFLVRFRFFIVVVVVVYLATFAFAFDKLYASLVRIAGKS